MLKFDVCVEENDDGKFMFSKNDYFATQILLTSSSKRHEVFNTKIYKHCIPLGGTAVDVGANIGLSTVVMANCVGNSGNVIAIEPQKILFQALCGNCFLNGLSNVQALNIAIGNEIGFLRLEPLDYLGGLFNFADVHVGGNLSGELVQTNKLDLIGLEGLDFLKIDVQGFELEVLSGARESIKHFRPAISIEIHEPSLQIYNKTANDLIDLIKSFDYRIFNIDINPEYPLLDNFCVHKSISEEEIQKIIAAVEEPCKEL